MAIRDWGEDEESEPAADEPKRKKSIGPAFWVALLIILGVSPWLGQVPKEVREFREELARIIPDVCAQEEWLLGGRVREAAELVDPGQKLERGDVAEFHASPAEARPGWPELGEFDGKTNRLKLRGFALSIPSPVDPLAPSRNSVEKLVYLDPETLEPLPKLISELESKDRSFSPLAKEFCTAQRWHPSIYLAFERLEPNAMFKRDSIFDERTGVDVSGAHAPLVMYTERGLVLRRGLGIWHDTPVRIALEVFDGELEWFRIAGLPLMPNGPDVEDLFEIRIPRTRYWTSSDQPDSRLDLIRAATELRGSGERWPLFRAEADGWFPVDLYDVTVREIAEDFAKFDPLAFDREQMALLRVRP